jgi:hypothetical protein
MLTIAACGDESADGALYITWKIGALSCDKADVHKVVASVYNYAQSEAIQSVTADCVDKSLQMENVPPGEYTLVLLGLDQEGCNTHEVRRETIIPEGNVKRIEDLPLLRRQRDVLAHWRFSNRLDCLGNGVHQVEMKLSIAGGYERTYLSLCEGFQAHLGGKLPLGSLTLAIRGLDADGNGIAFGSVTHERDIFHERPCDDSVRVQVPLQMCDLIDCDGQG